MTASENNVVVLNSQLATVDCGLSGHAIIFGVEKLSRGTLKVDLAALSFELSVPPGFVITETFRPHRLLQTAIVTLFLYKKTLATTVSLRLLQFIRSFHRRII